MRFVANFPGTHKVIKKKANPCTIFPGYTKVDTNFFFKNTPIRQ